MPALLDSTDSPVAADPSWPRGAALRLEDVAVTRRGTAILHDVNLTFEPNQRYVIVGPSGAGKSTLLRLLNRLDDPTTGSIFVGDRRLNEIPVKTVRTAVGMVFQNARPLPGNLAENLRYPFSVRGKLVPSMDSLRAAIVEVGLEPTWLDRDAAALSGGERQRLAVAVALMADPEILVVDEPTSALDPSAARDLTSALAARPIRVIAICHHREHAAWLGDTAIWMQAGRILDNGPTAELLARHDSATISGRENRNG
jgi:putative ABC transport system ATP-binding protein